ncbi:MAG TPA: hypothetical protein VMK31_08710 [Sphingomicrobium sp.]|nr:hypothetical protein [Sphingomicrobium sp.]
MKLFLVIALVALIAVLVLTLKRSRSRITRIEHRRAREDGDA